MIRSTIFLLGLVYSLACSAQAIDVAVASNFMAVAKVLKADFEQRSEHRINLVTGSTGKHYAQIVNGAPFDVFLAADSRRPQLLEQQGRVVGGNRFSYAIGELVLWSTDPDLVDNQGQVLTSPSFKRLALANPKLAPYGRAAQQVLNKMAPQLPAGKMLRGENINQAFQFVHSANADLGFVALSQLKVLKGKSSGRVLGSRWLVPTDFYDPIEQQAVQLSDNPAAAAFLAYLKSASGRKTIAGFGYRLPSSSALSPVTGAH